MELNSSGYALMSLLIRSADQHFTSQIEGERVNKLAIVPTGGGLVKGGTQNNALRRRPISGALSN